jgi:hypothetical protein
MGGAGVEGMVSDMSVPLIHDLVISPRRRSPEEVLTSELSSFIALMQAP